MKKRFLLMVLLLALLLPMVGLEASAEKVTESTGRMYGIATNGGVRAVTFELEVKASVSVLCSYDTGLSNVWLAKDGSAIALTPRSTYSGSDNFGDTYKYDVQMFYDLDPGTYHVWVAPHKDLWSTLYWVKVDATYEAHTHDYDSTKVVAPTCSERGYTKHTCDCGDSYKDNYTDKLPHTEAYAEEIPATCQKTGKTVGTYCSVCNTTLSGREEIPKTDHTYIDNICIHCGYGMGSCGKNLKWVLDTNGKLTITGTGAMYDYEMSGAPWYSGTNGVTGITLPDGLTYIGAYAFQRSEISGITIPGSVKTIGEGAFYDCGNLTRITIPDSVASIGAFAFYGCEGLTKVTLSQSLTALPAGIFSGCRGLSGITIPETVSSIGEYGFADCVGLTEIQIPDAVAAIGKQAFSNCTGLTGITVIGDAPAIGTAAFKYVTATVHCNEAAAGWENAADQDYGGSLSWNAEHSYRSKKTDHTCTEQGYTTHSCICGALYTDSYVEASHRISNGVCSQCGKVGTCGDDLTWEFDEKTGILTIRGTGSMKNYAEESGNRAPWYALGEALTGVVVEEGITDIGAFAFYNSYIKTAELPAGLKTIGAEAFYGSSLQECDIPDSVTSIGEWAFGDTNLTEVNVSANVTSGGERIFAACRNLRKATIACPRTFDDMFLWCSNLSEVVLTDNVKILGAGTFCDCYELTKIELPDSLTRIEGIKQVQPNPNVTSVGCTFRNCRFAAITIPESVTYIGDYAFQDCSELVSVTVPAAVTDIEAIFSGCTSLKTVFFQGDECLSVYYVTFDDVTATVYYPAAYASNWKKAQKIDWGGELTWVQYDPCAEHSYGQWERLADPDCTGPGVDSSSCENCEVIRYRSVAALGHEWDAGTRTKEPTEEKSGTMTYSCSVCDDTKTETLPRLAHTHSYAAQKTLPTCTAGGYTTYTCPCGDSYVGKETGATGHTKVVDKAEAPTCTEIGLTEGSHCSGCLLTFAGQKVIEELGHSWGAWITDAAQKYRICATCQTRETEGETGQNGENPFVDVAVDAYYAAPVLWAVKRGITNGMDATHFAPDGTCTRAQIVTFLWRANGSPKPVSSTNPFTDVPMGQWYTDAVLWAVENGITTGTSATTFSPDAGCTRGQVATFLWRAQGQPVSGGSNIFTDITPGAYYYDAVLWAVANGITNGMGDGTFAPDATCTRGQIVTFLYRAMA